MNTGMHGCLRMTKGASYALKAMAGLATGTRDRPVAIKALARAEGIPPSFLAKILRQLIRARLVSAKSGAQGGVALARPPAEISVLRILEVCEGSYERDDCIFYSATRCTGRNCPVYCLFRREEDRVRVALSAATVADLAALVARHPARAPDPAAAVAAGRPPAMLMTAPRIGAAD